VKEHEERESQWTAGESSAVKGGDRATGVSSSTPSSR
jgi:hypothetical protein